MNSTVKSVKSRRAENARRELVLTMGGFCLNCGGVEALEFHVVSSLGAAHHFYPWPERIRFYQQQFLAANLQLLCKSCHQRVTSQSQRKFRLPVILTTAAFSSPVVIQSCESGGISPTDTGSHAAR